ncbi:kinase [Mycobacterium phage MooMoo]|uniref:Serine/threonine kinase n=1 Tax=Mycobacterium phage MooMoo TaxID=2108127 RepID=A0A2P1JRE0_9CAUD|nr:kinase [Mycobacterium phage MooMoo]AVO21700.1 serine/threonine kinase [Mycobacterium phage MooMoo]
MGLATTTIHRRTVHKRFAQQSAWENELKAYRAMPWAAPKLVNYGPMWIETERCTPILNLHPNWSRRYAEPLWDLLAAIHDAGWWHCDPCLINVVIHPDRGVLLIDFENLTPATGTHSYDLYGAQAAGVPPAWEGQGPDGVYWGGPHDFCPGPYWDQP